MLISLTKENYLPVFIINGRHTDRPSVSVCVSGGGKTRVYARAQNRATDSNFIKTEKGGTKNTSSRKKIKKDQKYLYSFFFMIQKGYICTLQKSTSGHPTRG